jgi:predicted membrane chloride channel (bestrophin family)
MAQPSPGPDAGQQEPFVVSSPADSPRKTGDPKQDEKTPLLDPYAKLQCYSLSESHCKIHEGLEVRHIISYDVQKLTTFRVFFALAGTVLTDIILWIETLAGALVFWVVFAGIWHIRWDGLDSFVGKESNIRAFLAMFSTLVGLLLSFYTSLNIKRWWDMRMLGVGGIWQASSKLTLQISQGVTRDPEVLDAIWRYSAASLAFLFMMRRGTQDRIENMVKRGLLTEAECQQMAKIPAAQRAEAIWSWLGCMVSQLNAQGLVNGPPNYAGLMATVDKGRTGANVINSYLDTPIPMAYVHLLGLMVKLHNLMVAIFMGILSSSHFTNGDELGAFRTMFRAFFMPFLYNAILLINDDISDPFSGDISDFPLQNFVRSLRDDAKSIVAAGERSSLPHWLLQGKKFKKWSEPEEA